MRTFLPAVFAAMLVLPATAQDFTTSAGVKPLLDLTKAQWVAIRPYEGQDLLYFTTLLVYRCGIQQIRFSYNDGPFQVLDHEPCHTGEANPTALKLDTHLPYVAAPLNGLETVGIELSFDDGTVMSANYTRAEIEIN